MTQGPFDKQLIRRRAARLALAGPGAMPEALHAHVADEMLARLATCDDDFAEALLIATAPADFASRLGATGRVKHVRHAAAWAVPAGGGHDLALDLESPALEPDSLDLVLSLFDLALVNDLPGALRHIRAALKPGGLLLAALPGEGSLHELRAAWALADTEAHGSPQPRVAPFVDIRQMGTLLQLAGFADPVVDVEPVTLRHRDALALMRELKALGWSNPLRERPRTPVSRRLLATAAAAHEAAHADDDGKVRASFQMLHVFARAPMS